MRDKKLPPEKVAILLRLHARGWSQHSIARHLGCHQTCVLRWLRRRGRAANPPSTPHKRRKKRQALRHTCRVNGLPCLVDFARVRREIARLRQGPSQGPARARR